MKLTEESEKAEKKAEKWKNSTFKKQRSWHPVPSLHWHIDGEKMETVKDYSWAPKSIWMVTAGMKLKDTCSLEEKV